MDQESKRPGIYLYRMRMKRKCTECINGEVDVVSYRESAKMNEQKETKRITSTWSTIKPWLVEWMPLIGIGAFGTILFVAAFIGLAHNQTELEKRGIIIVEYDGNHQAINCWTQFTNDGKPSFTIAGINTMQDYLADLDRDKQFAAKRMGINDVSKCVSMGRAY